MVSNLVWGGKRLLQLEPSMKYYTKSI